MVEITELKDISVDDFVSGLIASGTLLGMRTWSLAGDRLDRGAEAAFFKLKEKTGGVAFRIRCHPIHGDSSAFRDALLAAAQRGLVTFDCPGASTVRPAIDADWANSILEGLPGDEGFWKEVGYLFNYTS